MTLNELNREQQLVLVALVEAVTLSDGVVSDREEGQISKLADALGDEVYRDLLEEVNAKFAGVDEVKAALGNVTNVEVRELIYGTILEETMASPTAEHGDIAILNWLRDAWNMSDTEVGDTA